MNTLFRKREALLRHLAAVGPLIDGSLVTIARTCGTPTCKCHTSGEKHRSFYLTYKGQRRKPGEPAKTKTLYIPVDLEKEVQKWSQECAKARELIRQVSEIQRELIRAYVSEHGRGRKKKGKLK
jgi:hypothetical protein